VPSEQIGVTRYIPAAAKSASPTPFTGTAVVAIQFVVVPLVLSKVFSKVGVRCDAAIVQEPASRSGIENKPFSSVVIAVGLLLDTAGFVISTVIGLYGSPGSFFSFFPFLF